MFPSKNCFKKYSKKDRSPFLLGPTTRVILSVHEEIVIKAILENILVGRKSRTAWNKLWQNHTILNALDSKLS